MERLTAKRNCEIAFYEPITCKFSNKNYIHNVLKREIENPVCKDNYYNSGIVTEEEIKDMYVKLSHYEDLEEQIGCPLEVRCQLYNGALICDTSGKILPIYSINKNNFECKFPIFEESIKAVVIMQRIFSFSDYKITWWLKADRSE